MLIAHEWLSDGVASDAEYQEDVEARLKAIEAEKHAKDVPNADNNTGAVKATNRAIGSDEVCYVLELTEEQK